MSHPQKLRGCAVTMATFATIIGLFALASVLTAAIYDVCGLHPSVFLAQMITTVLGLLFCGLIIGGLGFMLRSKQAMLQMGVFHPIIEAMQKIAKGDFSVRIDNTFRDNQPINELTKNVNNMAVKLSEWEAMRQEFVSNVSHELQSPLTSIRGFAQVLQNDGLSADARCHYLTIIEAESVRLSKLTDNLLKLATLDAKHSAVTPKTYALDKQIRAIILACEPQWTDKAIALDVALDATLITADEDLLSQVWMNLIHNSMKFTAIGGSIAVTLHKSGSAVEVAIKDTGIGIGPEDIPHIFERFYKADKVRRRSDVGGSGLGLSIVQNIVTKHNGTVTVESAPGAGTTFVVTLPLWVPEPNALPM